MTLLASGCEEKMSAEEIATKMQEKQASLEDYSYTMYTATYLNGEKNLEDEIQIMYKKPNMMKTLSVVEGKEVESVSDGEFAWGYDAETNTVTKMKLPDEPLIKDSDFVSIIGNFMNESDVSMLGVEEVDGRYAYVLEARPRAEENELELVSRTKIWVDRETWIILRCNTYNNKGNLTTETEIRDLKVNTGIPDSEFKFEIPDGAEVKTIDMDEVLKVPDSLSLEEARQQVSFEILTPQYIPDGYVLNSTMIYEDNYSVTEGQGSEVVILNYQKGTEVFDIEEKAYENETEENPFMQGAEEISINGKEGRYLNEFGTLKMLQWELGRVQITLSGSLEKAEMLKIAESIQEPLTEFYILGPEGKAENYPTDYVVGENGTVIVGVVSHECKPVNYTMEVWLENESLPLPADQKNIFLGNSETWEKAVIITPPFEGTNMNLRFLLYNADKKDTFEGDTNMPYRDLHLWINVAQNLSENASTPLMAV
jgi:outer membrane lipoprotein-sorting protein